MNERLDKKFLEAMFPGHHTVLGRKLNPFCLWHVVALEAIQSPFILDKPPTFIDLFLAVKICSSENKDVLSLIKITPLSRLKITIDSMVFWFNQELAKFRHYLESHLVYPQLWFPPTGKRLKAPWPMINLVLILRHTSLHPDEIWDMPLGEVLWLSASIAEQIGAETEIMTEAEIAAIKHAEKFLQEQTNAKD